MGNIFAGIAETDRDSGGRNKFITDGTYLFETEKFIGRESTHPDSEGEHMVIIEVTVLEVLRAIEGKSLKVGEKAVAIWKLERTPKGGLTTKGARNMGRVKSCVAALLGGAPDEAITAEVCGTLAAGDGEQAKGIRIKCDAVTSVSKEGKAFTNLTWSAV